MQLKKCGCVAWRFPLPLFLSAPIIIQRLCWHNLAVTLGSDHFARGRLPALQKDIQKAHFMKLIIKLIAGITLGILLGLFAPEWITRILITVKALFAELLFFTVPLLILFFITSGIAALPQKSGQLLGRSLGVA
jgi:hypothetical protein